jgi:hypothetical protein
MYFPCDFLLWIKTNLFSLNIASGTISTNELLAPLLCYLDLKLVALSTTFTTRLPSVLAHPVYYPHVKAKPCGCSASLHSLDMGGAWSLARTGRGRGRDAAADD